MAKKQPRPKAEAFVPNVGDILVPARNRVAPRTILAAANDRVLYSYGSGKRECLVTTLQAWKRRTLAIPMNMGDGSNA